MMQGVPTRVINPVDWQTLKTSSKDVTTAGTAVPLSATTVPVNQVMVQAKITNGGYIYVGPSSVANDNSNGILLNKGDVVMIEISDLRELYINSTVNGEGVTFLYW